MRTVENSRFYPWLLLTPTLILFAIWNLIPLFWMVGMSFYNYSLTLGRPPRFVGFRNYLDYLENPDLWIALSHTLIFVFFSVVLTTLLGSFLGALFWRSSKMPGRRLALTLLFSPMILTPAAIGTFFRLNYDPTFGIFGYFTKLITGRNIEYLGAEGWAFAALVAVDVWMWTPFMVLIILAALGSVPAAELEAAQIDRLSLWRQFRYVIFPHARFIIILGVILRTIDAFKVTDLVYQLTRGGPGGTTEVIGVMMFRKAFEAFSVGWTSGVAVITLFTAISFTAIFLYLLNTHKRKKAYE